MPYSQFTLESVKTIFDLAISEQFGIFADISKLEPSGITPDHFGRANARSFLIKELE